MIKRWEAIAAALPLALAACGPTSEAESPAETIAESPIPVEPDGGIGDGAGPPDTTIATTIPARFQGVWDDAASDCARGSELRLEIAPGSVTFYESFGRVTGVVEEGEDVLVDLEMEGEGETWTETERLWLVDAGGETLLHTGDGTQPKVRDDTPRQKCD